jgi:putative spermidine/putrescine transport system substrate-binding protein
MHADDGPRDRRLLDHFASGIAPAPMGTAGGSGPVVIEGRAASMRGARELEEALTIKQSMPRLLTLGAGLMIVAAACGGSGTGSPAATSGAGASGGTSAVKPWTPDATLLSAAKAEGGLTTIALPPTWCDYQDLLSGFTSKTGIAVNNLNPDGSSQQELDAITANKDNKGPAAPDVVDVGLAYGPKGIAQNLFAKYQVSTWADIPDSAKDKDGYWYGDYYGVMSFEINTAVITSNAPADWSDLLKQPANSVALAGDPTGSNQAVSAVWAAALGNGGSLDDASAGLTFFKQLNDKKIFVPVIAKAATVASGETPIVLAWTYNALADRDQLKGNPAVNVVVPKTGKLGGMYVQAISAYAPHPNAAKLWMEWLYSDEGQNIWLKGYCNPIRYDAMSKAGAVDSTLAAKLPDTSGASLPTLDQITKANTTITTGWPTTVGVTVK